MVMMVIVHRVKTERLHFVIIEIYVFIIEHSDFVLPVTIASNDGIRNATEKKIRKVEWERAFRKMSIKSVSEYRIRRDNGWLVFVYRLMNLLMM